MISHRRNWKSNKGRKYGRELKLIIRIKNHLIKYLIKSTNGKENELYYYQKTQIKLNHSNHNNNNNNANNPTSKSRKRPKK